MSFDGFRSGGSYEGKPFWQMDGPSKETGAACSMKVCLVATDIDYLVEVLRGIAGRPDCFGVKFSEGHRDGMHLGRAVLVDEEATAALVAELKRDGKLMTTLQDDAFFVRFRSSS